MKKILKENKAITLIALVITIVVLIILAGVLINLTLGKNGIFIRAKNAKEKYEYASAKEIVDIKLLNIKTDCLTEGEEYTLDLIADRIGDDNEISTDIVHFYATAKNKSDNERPSAIKGILVSANKYPKYKFLIGEKGEVIQIIGVTKGNIPTTWDSNAELPTGIESLEEFELSNFGGEVTTDTEQEEQLTGHEDETEILNGGEVTIGETTYTRSYDIWTKAQLEDFRDKVNAGDTFANAIVRQKANINLNNEAGIPIGDISNGDNSKYFAGTFDGENHKVTGFKIDNTKNNQAFFGLVDGGKIKNLTVEGSVHAGWQSAGIVAFLGQRRDGKLC